MKRDTVRFWIDRKDAYEMNYVLFLIYRPQGCYAPAAAARVKRVAN